MNGDFQHKDLQTPWKTDYVHHWINPKFGAGRLERIKHLLKFITQMPPGRYNVALSKDFYYMIDGEGRTVKMPYEIEAKHINKLSSKWSVVKTQGR